jgi:hypothetical protein
VLWSLAYSVVRRLFGLVVLPCRSPRSKELKILMLHHELAILRPQTRRPRLREADRLLLSPHSEVEEQEGHAADPPNPSRQKARHQDWRPSGALGRARMGEFRFAGKT